MPAPDDSHTEANKLLVHRHINEAWNQGRVNNTLLAADVHLHDPVFPNLDPGARNVRNHIQACRRAFPDLTFTIDDTVAERNEVVIHWTARGTHMGDFLGMQPTHRPATVTGTSIYRLEGSRIVEEWAHWNLMSMIEQLNVPKAAPPKPVASARPRSKADTQAEHKTRPRRASKTNA